MSIIKIKQKNHHKTIRKEQFNFIKCSYLAYHNFLLYFTHICIYSIYAVIHGSGHRTPSMSLTNQRGLTEFNCSYLSAEYSQQKILCY
jgi:hypothetical protein